MKQHLFRSPNAAAMLVLACATAGCIASTVVGSEGASGSDSDGTSTATTSTTSSSMDVSSTSSAGAGGESGDGNDTLETAVEVAFGAQVEGTLSPEGLDRDYFKFSGAAGQKVRIAAVAGTIAAPYAGFDEAHVDPVVTLFDEGKWQLAQNNDGYPWRSLNSELFTVLPADGIYYVRVGSCRDERDDCMSGFVPSQPQYTLSIGPIDPSVLVSEAASGATPLGAYESDGPEGELKPKLLAGTFTSEVEKDLYTFTAPSIAPVAGWQSRMTFYFFADTVYGEPLGPGEGDGSSDAIQTATLKDGAGTVVGEIPVGPGYLLELPFTSGAAYTLELAHERGALRSNPFYYVYTLPNDFSLPVESGADNDVTPESLQQFGSARRPRYSIFGHIDVARGDVDQFSFAVPAGAHSVTIPCWSKKLGSGLSGLTISVADEAGAPVVDATATGSSGTDAMIEGAPVPSGTATLRVSASAQDPRVTGSYYSCGIYVLPVP